MNGVVKIKYINGKEESFVFTPKFDPLMMANRIKELLSLPALIFQLENGMTVIPIANIESISIVHSKLGRNAISIPLAIAASRFVQTSE